MKLNVAFFCILFAMIGVPEAARAQVAAAGAFAASTQLVVVTTTDWNAVEGSLQRYERATPNDAWLPAGESTSVVVGRNGLAWGIGVGATDDANTRGTTDPVKKEGDGRAPAGIFALGTSFGYATQPLPGSKMPYLHLTGSIECVDDPNSKYYNRVIDRSTVVPDWNSSEHMRSIGEYRWGVVIGQNRSLTDDGSSPPVPRGGSCVFLHIWDSPSKGTAGCTATAQIEVERLLTWLDPIRRPLLVQLPQEKYRELTILWKLPRLASGHPR